MMMMVKMMMIMMVKMMMMMMMIMEVIMMIMIFSFLYPRPFLLWNDAAQTSADIHSPSQRK